MSADCLLHCSMTAFDRDIHKNRIFCSAGKLQNAMSGPLSLQSSIFSFHHLKAKKCQ